MKFLGITILSFVLFIGYASSNSSDVPTCTRCLKDNSCKPPDCFCCRNELKLPMSMSDIPQIVFFTFDDALTERAAEFYYQLFNVTDRKNPNGCPVSMTMFISHHDTKYDKVNEFYRKGMEIAAHSVTHKHMTTQNFLEEAKSQKNNLAKLGGVPENEIVGWRSPFLEPVGDMQPDKLKELGYVYDATLTFSKRNLHDKPPTPFTLDFGWPYDCKVKPCPRRRHFGFWEVPVVSLLDYKHKYDCVYVDGCNSPPPDESSAYKFLMDNFNSYYSRSRVPFGINMHPSWFYTPHRLKAMDRFIQSLLRMNDVYIVSVDKMIKWLKNPTPLSRLHDFEPWSCPTVKSHSHVRNSRRHNGRNTFNFKSTMFNKNRRGKFGGPRMSREEMHRRHIQARLQQIAQMRAQIDKDREKQMLQMKRHDEAQSKWWSKPTSMRSQTSVKSRSNAHQGPTIMRKTVNRTRVQTTEISKPKFQFSKAKKNMSKGKKINKSKSKKKGSKVPFWKRPGSNPKHAPKPAFKSANPWWNKPVPKIKNVKKVEIPDFTTTVTTPRPTTLATPKPIVDFVKQLKEQEQQRQRIIDDQKKRQREQLKKMQRELRRNQKIAIEKQEREERQRLEAKLGGPVVNVQPTTPKTEMSTMVQPNTQKTKSRIEGTFDPWKQFVKHLMGQRNRT